MASSSFSASTPPAFNSENYPIWAVKMKAYLRAFDLWEVTENGTENPPLVPNPTLAQIKSHSEEKAKRFKALTAIDSYIHPNNDMQDGE